VYNRNNNTGVTIIQPKGIRNLMDEDKCGFKDMADFVKAIYKAEVLGIGDARLEPLRLSNEEIAAQWEQAKEIFTEERLNALEAWADSMLKGEADGCRTL